ncbi:MAG: SDR family NAD(P)-dependent oxidoreductase [Spirochaetota bacterium]
MNLNSKKICITGTSSGIGYAMAKKLYQANNQIIAVSRNVSGLCEEFPQWHVYSCDLANSEQVENLCIALAKEHPDLDVLVNNAGVQKEIDLQQTYEWSQELMRELFLNLHAAVQLTLGVLPILLAREEAKIINITSVLGYIPKNTVPLYSASKSGLGIFSKCLQGQLTGSHVRVHEVIPPLVATPMNEHRIGNKMQVEEFVEKVVTGVERGKTSIQPGKASLIMQIHRFFPSLARKVINSQ